MDWLDKMGFSPDEKAKILEVGGKIEGACPGATYHIAWACLQPPLDLAIAERLTPGGGEQS